MVKTAIIILNYNGWKDTIECIDSLKNVRTNHITIVVDNNSTDDSYIKLQENLNNNVIIIQLPQNLGYAGGNNAGIKKAYELGCDYFCVLNNDTIAESDFLEPCISYLAETEDIGFLGPAIVDYYNGRVQSTGGFIKINEGKFDRKNAGMDANLLPHIIKCDYVGGACIIFQRKILDELGYIPESYFLFFEETEWCYKALKNGYNNICIGDIVIKHKGSVSIKKIGGLNEYLLYRNKIAFIRRNHSCKFIAFSVFIYLCIQNIAKALVRHNMCYIQQIVYYFHGWFKKIDYFKYPFIFIVE